MRRTYEWLISSDDLFYISNTVCNPTLTIKASSPLHHWSSLSTNNSMRMSSLLSDKEFGGGMRHSVCRLAFCPSEFHFEFNDHVIKSRWRSIFETFENPFDFQIEKGPKLKVFDFETFRIIFWAFHISYMI